MTNDQGHILVVDDHKTNRLKISMAVKKLGHTTATAEDGRQALQMLRAQPFDLVLLDIIMPEMNGYQVLAQMKADSTLRDIPVIVISAEQELTNVVQGIELGAEDYLPKTFDPVLLKARIRACLEKKHFRAQEVEYLRQVDRLTEAAAAIENETFDPESLSDVAARPDSLGQLTRVFQQMAHEFYLREQRLKQQVEELRTVSDLVGKTLGKYRLLARLGRGGVAEVYQAYQTSLKRNVALKVLHGHLADETDFIVRFEREAELMAKLRHANIVQIHDFDVEAARYYLVMELINGPTLMAELEARQAANRPFSLPEIAHIYQALASAVDFAHAQGMVHHDLKPANVMFTADGDVVLTDFGFARIIGTGLHTGTGKVVGTPAYMAPEQGQGERGDLRSDIYALGVILFELVTGRVPFRADTPFALMMKLMNDPPCRPSRSVNGCGGTDHRRRAAT
jgi:DNA-binding response OmpR family regulator/tRNA A-37 threonylcarbamoyl transferase component Bud32